MSANTPAVMVSSTFYDLRQVRADLAHFIEQELGYRSLLSEHHSFPIDPDADTIENCRRRVEREADILVLVVGGRYGFVEESSKKSITNLEYLAARSKGIPIYAFFEKGILALLPVWESSPAANFSHAVSDTRVFEFIRSVRSVDRVWTHEFEYAQDIVRVLRAQFAFLFKDSLQVRLRFRAEDRPGYTELHGKALRIVWERPEAWEFLLFGQVLVDEVQACADIRREHRLGLVFGSGEHISDPTDAVAWMQPKMTEVRRMIDAFNLIIGKQLQEALGPLGTPGDPEAIVFAAKKVGALYRHAIEWSQAVRRTHVPECFQPVAEAMAGFTDDVIDRVEEFGASILTQIPAALARRGEEPPQILNLTLVLTLSNEENFHAALQKAENDCFGIKQSLKRWL